MSRVTTYAACILIGIAQLFQNFSGDEIATPFGTYTVGQTNDTMVVTGSGRARARTKSSTEDFDAEQLLSKANFATPQICGNKKQKADLSMHHIDSIKSPLDFGSPVIP
jgi:hypothetical protein